jgi:hypothetical protein
VQWTDHSEDALALQQIRKFVERVQEVARERGNLLGFVFMNDAGFFQDVLKSYGTNKLQELNAPRGK